MAFQAWLRKQAFAQSVQKRAWGVVMSILKDAYDTYDLPDKTSRVKFKIKEKEKAGRALSKEEINEIYNYSKTRIIREGLKLRVFILTGMRRSEVSNLRISDVDLKDINNAAIRPSTSKTINGINRYIPIPSFLANEIKEYINGSDREYLFTSSKDKTKPCYGGASFNTVSAYCKKYNKEPFGLHDFRRTYITHLTLSGIPRPIIKAIVGHGLGADVHDLYIRVDPAQTGSRASPAPKCVTS